MSSRRGTSGGVTWSLATPPPWWRGALRRATMPPWHHRPRRQSPWEEWEEAATLDLTLALALALTLSPHS